jgi:hypothetical protein
MMQPQTPMQKPQLLEKLLETVRACETTSCALNRRSENVVVEAIIVPELKLRNVKWHVFPANLVERTDDTAFENRPETLNRLGVNSAYNILVFGMVNGRVREFFAEMVITDPLIGAEQANLFRHGFI